jgi:hypothetical protein
MHEAQPLGWFSIPLSVVVGTIYALFMGVSAGRGFYKMSMCVASVPTLKRI